jgi:hypothetical protein
LVVAQLPWRCLPTTRLVAEGRHQEGHGDNRSAACFYGLENRRYK